MAKLPDGTRKWAGCYFILSGWQQQSPYEQHQVSLQGLSQSFAESTAEEFQSIVNHSHATGEDTWPHLSSISGKQ